MKWPLIRRGFALLAAQAQLWRHRNPAPTASEGARDTLPTAPITSKPPLIDETPPLALPDLTARATVYYNRDQAKVARYLRMHDLLRQPNVTFSGDET